ncbi:hypothetical protein KCP76_16030 [Salmonella enterica subsp. enterica serovar Weltevreden]|nr:hypothetical protein KCP76_16030 [Salmonella enterica subsp. enterica serovar Weltevreden]
MPFAMWRVYPHTALFCAKSIRCLEAAMDHDKNRRWPPEGKASTMSRAKRSFTVGTVASILQMLNCLTAP